MIYALVRSFTANNWFMLALFMVMCFFFFLSALSGCRTCTLTSSPSPFSSSSPENVEDSGLDSPFHPFSGPSPDSRPWTPRDDSSTTDSCLVTSFADLQIDLTNANSTEPSPSEKSDTWEQQITAPSPPVFSCTKIGVAELFSTSQGT